MHLDVGSFSARERATYQVAPHRRGVPLHVDGPQEAEQQGVAHPLGPVVAAVALPATANKKKKDPNNAGASPFGPIDAFRPLTLT